MKLTPAQHTVLARMSDEEWHRGYDIECEPITLAALNNLELIRGANDGRFGYRDDLWTITPEGITAINEAGGEK